MSQLIEFLQTELANYKELIGLAELKRKAIVENNLDEIKRINSEENTVIGHINRLDKKRQSLIVDIAGVLNRRPEDITMLELSRLLGQEAEASLLKDITLEISDSLKNLRELTDHNRQLIDSALDYIDFSINIIHTSMGSALTSDGMELSGRSGFLDIKN